MGHMKTLSEIAQELRVSKRTVYRWLKSGKLKALRLDGIYRVEEQSYLEFIEEGRRILRAE